MKKWVLVICFLYTLFCVPIMAAPIYSKQEVIPVAEGVNLTKVERFYSDHNLTYSYITADLSEEYLDLKLLTPETGIDTLDTVASIAGATENTVAAMNADFFSVYSGNTGFSLGIEIQDGALLQSPINPSTMATVYKEDNQLFMSYLDFHIMVVAPDWEYREIRHLNKHTSYFGDILMYTSEFNGGYSPAPGGEVLEVVVEDGKIREFRRKMPPCKIPENGCVLVISEGADMFFAKHFKEGDPVKFDYYITPELSRAQDAFGGGAMLVSEGKALTSFSHVVSGYQPRSAIGVDKSGERVVLLAVNGRQAGSRGVTMTELAELMCELGSYTAVNLDGGGSTNMVASTVWAPSLHTVNSPTENRRVINAVGIIGDMESDGEPDGIILETEEPAVFIGQSTKISYAVYDQSKHAVAQKASLFSNKGKIKDNMFTGTRGGEAMIYAECGDAEGEIAVFVVDEIAGIVMDESFVMDVGDSLSLSFDVFDEAGHYVHVTNTEPFTFHSSDTKIASFKNGKLTAKKEGSVIITVEKDGVKHYAAVYVGADEEEYTDAFEIINGSFDAYPAGVTGKYALSEYFSVSGDYAGQLSYDFTSNTDQTRGAYLVLDNPLTIAASCKEISILCASDKEFSHAVKAQITDGEGTVHRISFEGEIAPLTMQEITAKIPKNLKAPITLTRIYAVALPDEAGDTGHLFFDDLSLSIAVPPEQVQVPAAEYGDSMEARGASKKVFSVGAVSKEEICLLDRLTYLGVKKQIEQKGAYALIGGMRPDDAQLSGDGFGIREEGNALYITIKTQKGGIRSTDASQWDKIYAYVEDTEADCIFILSDTDVYSSDAFENEAMEAYLGSLSQDVFVIWRGERNSLKIKNNVRYFTLSDPTDAEKLSAYSYLQFSLEDEVSYTWKQIW